MRSLSTLYPGQVDTSDAAGFPLGKPRDRSVAGALDGTPWRAEIAGDMHGALQAILGAGGISAANGLPEKVGQSQVVAALQTMFVEPSELTTAITTDHDRTDANALVAALSSMPRYPAIAGAGGRTVVAAGLSWPTASSSYKSDWAPLTIVAEWINGSASNGFRELNQDAMGAPLDCSVPGTSWSSVETVAIPPATYGTTLQTGLKSSIVYCGGYIGNRAIYCLTQGGGWSTVQANIAAAVDLLGVGWDASKGCVVVSSDSSSGWVRVATSLDGVTWTERDNRAIGAFTPFRNMTGKQVICGQVEGQMSYRTFQKFLVRPVSIANSVTLLTVTDGIAAVAHQNIEITPTHGDFFYVDSDSTNAFYAASNGATVALQSLAGGTFSGAVTTFTPYPSAAQAPIGAVICFVMGYRRLVLILNNWSHQWDCFWWKSDGTVVPFALGIQPGGALWKSIGLYGTRIGFFSSSSVPAGSTAGTPAIGHTQDSRLDYRAPHQR